MPWMPPDAPSDTVVVLWSDHGWHLGEKGITGKNSLWERSTRVPLDHRRPGRLRRRTLRPAGRAARPVPDLVELCGLPPRHGLEGHSLVPQLKDATAPRPWPAITTHNRGSHSVRSERWRYIRYADGTEELYDHEAIPTNGRTSRTTLASPTSMRDHARWLPAHEALAAPGSTTRFLNQQDGIWYWERQPIVPGEWVRKPIEKPKPGDAAKKAKTSNKSIVRP